MAGDDGRVGGLVELEILGSGSCAVWRLWGVVVGHIWELRGSDFLGSFLERFVWTAAFCARAAWWEGGEEKGGRYSGRRQKGGGYGAHNGSQWRRVLLMLLVDVTVAALSLEEMLFL